eukprot:TRINITY_DN1187_c0_g1_i5.p1 TRINITY_DN1187_c0_g1~~TRINITY_DN1187_c0_g1_i5.p1  ORF type:complete len:240 (+),score=7.45 TRINITY_DN1187_c0_g1_i5:354-1073(+)
MEICSHLGIRTHGYTSKISFLFRSKVKETIYSVMLDKLNPRFITLQEHFGALTIQSFSVSPNSGIKTKDYRVPTELSHSAASSAYIDHSQSIGLLSTNTSHPGSPYFISIINFAPNQDGNLSSSSILNNTSCPSGTQAGLYSNYLSYRNVSNNFVGFFSSSVALKFYVYLFDSEGNCESYPVPIPDDAVPRAWYFDEKTSYLWYSYSNHKIFLHYVDTNTMKFGNPISINFQPQSMVIG